MQSLVFHHPPAFAEAASRRQARPARAGLVRGTEVTKKFHRERNHQVFLQSGDTDWRKTLLPLLGMKHERLVPSF
jgi:hypothetical protein